MPRRLGMEVFVRFDQRIIDLLTGWLTTEEIGLLEKFVTSGSCMSLKLLYNIMKEGKNSKPSSDQFPSVVSLLQQILVGLRTELRICKSTLNTFTKLASQWRSNHENRHK